MAGMEIHQLEMLRELGALGSVKAVAETLLVTPSAVSQQLAALQKTVDTYSASERDQFAVYTLSGLPSGTHTLRIHVRGTKNAASGGAWVWV